MFFRLHNVMLLMIFYTEITIRVIAMAKLNDS